MQNILKFQVGFSFCAASRKSSCLKRKTRELTKNYMSVCWEIHPRVSTIYTNTVFTLGNNSLLKWQVRKYIMLEPWSKFTRLYVLSISIVLMVPGHMEVIGLGGMGMLMTYIRSAGGHLLLGKFSCLLALKMWHLVVRECQDTL